MPLCVLNRHESFTSDENIVQIAKILSVSARTDKFIPSLSGIQKITEGDHTGANKDCEVAVRLRIRKTAKESTDRIQVSNHTETSVSFPAPYQYS